MRNTFRYALVLALAIAALGACGRRQHRSGAPTPAPVLDSLELFTQSTDADADIDWDEDIPVFHFFARVDLDLLDGGSGKAQSVLFDFIVGFHRRFEVLRQSLLQCHAYTSFPKKYPQ